MPRKLRILALHGYTSNAFVLQRRMGAIRKACRDVADFCFLNGQLRVEPITAAPESLDAPTSQYTAANDPNMPLEEQPRAWWRSGDEDGVYRHLDETIDFVCSEVERQGPFDGVLGFSQGACFAAILASAFEDPARYPRFQQKLPKMQGPLRFCVAISGFRARDPNIQGLFPAAGIQTPILHVLGRADQIVNDERSQTLVDVAAKSRIERHDSGHVVPSQAPWRSFYRDFFATFQEAEESDKYEPNDEWAWITGPSDRPKGETSHSEAASGAATPDGKSEKKSSL